MNENGAEQRGGVLRDVTNQVSDTLDLASLELRYETQEAGKKLLAGGIILVLILTGFIVLQVAVIGALMRTGLSLGPAALIVSLVYFVLAGVIFMKFGRRDKRVGPPFAETQREIHETLQWIQKTFS